MVIVVVMIMIFTPLGDTKYQSLAELAVGEGEGLVGREVAGIIDGGRGNESAGTAEVVPSERDVGEDNDVEFGMEEAKVPLVDDVIDGREDDRMVDKGNGDA